MTAGTRAARDPGVVVIVLAKTPVPGQVKTRLCPPLSPARAADVAAAALLDTLDSALAVPGARVVVALTGDLTAAARAAAVRAALGSCVVVPQRGDTLGARIAAAHADTAVLLPGRPTLQIGMDTPQADSELLAAGLAALGAAPPAPVDMLAAGAVAMHRRHDGSPVMLKDLPGRVGPDAVLGLATDGGWWALGLRDPRAANLLTGVRTSCADTGARTVAALRAGGLRVALLPELTDVDTVADARVVSARIPRSRFAAAVACL